MQKISPVEAIKILKEGNQRFAAGLMQNPRQDSERRLLTSQEGQHPIAAVLSCSDSRVPIEAIFDQGIGDIFVIRVAGNVAGASEIGSIEYAVEHLNVGLLVVLGHSRCGAVTAAVKDESVHGCITQIKEKIMPAVKKARQTQHQTLEELIEMAARENVWRSIEDVLNNGSGMRTAVESGKIAIAGAYYDIRSGLVEWMESRYR